MKTNWKAELPTLIVIVLMWGLAAWAWPRVPAPMPVHFDLAGTADRFGSRTEGLLLLPIVVSFLYALLLVWPRLDPRRGTFALFARPYALVRLTVFTLFLLVYSSLVATALGRPVRVDSIISVAAAIAIVLLGNYLPKIQPNWIIGVRTPWTLSSDLAWRRTHRLAGPLLVAAGFLSLAVALFRPDAATYVMLSLLVVTAVISAIYSYLVWRQDPARS